jgi:hypothetical protein
VCAVCAVVSGCALDVNEKTSALGAHTKESVHVDLDDGDLLGVLVELRDHVVHVAHPRTLRILLELQLLLSNNINISTRHARPHTTHTTAHGTHGRRVDAGTFSLLRLPTCQGRWG